MNAITRGGRRPSLTQLALLVAVLLVEGGLEGLEVRRQRARGVSGSQVDGTEDRHPQSGRALAVTWWPAGLASVLIAMWANQFDIAGSRRSLFLGVGLLVAAVGVALRQWAITTLGRFFVGQVLVQQGQIVITSGPYAWLRHPSYTGFWLEMLGIGIALGNALSIVICALLPLVGIIVRIQGEERELSGQLAGYEAYAQSRARLIPMIW